MAAARPGGRGPIRWGNASGSRQAAPAPQTSASRPADKIAEEYGGEKVANMRYNYITLTPEQMADDTALERFESSPTFTRDRKRAELPSSGRQSSAQQEPEESPRTGTQITF